MMEEAQPSDDLRDAQTARFLEWTLRCCNEVVDQVADRLAQSDGATFLEDGLHHPDAAAAAGRPLRSLLVDGGASLGELRLLKEEFKTRDAESDLGSDRRLAASLGYLLVQAAAVHHYGTWIGQTSRAELRGSFASLAAVLPTPWSELCRDAAKT